MARRVRRQAGLAALKRPWNPWTYNLAGIPSDRWWRLLKENRFAIDPVFADRFVFHTLFSYVNSAYRRREEHEYGAAIQSTQVEQAPIFVIGQHRSGTTHLHNLLSLDDEQFAYPTSYQAAFPFSFLCSEKALSRIVALMLLKKRPMDNMAIDVDQAQEDEFALGLVSLCSPYLWFAFPRHYDRYLPYVTFQAASPEQVKDWQAALVWFAKKLTLKHGRRLVLKSPFHAARIKLILESFPAASFIHIHRDPYTVFQSLQHMFATFPWYLCLQDPGAAFGADRLIEQGTIVTGSFFRDRAAIPDGQFHELSFASLLQDPLGQMGLIYERFGLDGFGRIEAKLRRYLHSLAGYRQNTFPELPPALREKVARAWRASFEEWGYPE